MAAKNPARTPLKAPTPHKNDVKGQTSSALQKLFGVSGGEVVAEGLKLVPPAQIQALSQPRTSFPASEIEELAASIRTLRSQGGGIQSTGILQPLLVRPVRQGEFPSADTRYVLIAGERRLRASRLVELPQVPVIVLGGANLSDPSLTIGIQIIENLQRRDLAPLEEARALKRLMNENQVSIRDAALLLGKPKSYLSDRLALLKMGEDVQQLVAQRSDTLLHARVLSGVSDPDLRLELIESVRQGASLREIQRRLTAPSALSQDLELSERSDTQGAGAPGAGAPLSKNPKLSERSDSRDATLLDPDPSQGNSVSERSDSAESLAFVEEAVAGEELLRGQTASGAALDEAASALGRLVIEAQSGVWAYNKAEQKKMQGAVRRIEVELEKLRPLLGLEQR